MLGHLSSGSKDLERILDTFFCKLRFSREARYINAQIESGNRGDEVRTVRVVRACERYEQEAFAGEATCFIGAEHDSELDAGKREHQRGGLLLGPWHRHRLRTQTPLGYKEAKE